MKSISKTEDMLYEAMVSIGLKPERQYPISQMHVDFAFPIKRLVIEVDGSYKRNADGMQKLFNRKRICEREGWKVENFTAEEVFENPRKYAWRIYYILGEIKAKKIKNLTVYKKNATDKNWLEKQEQIAKNNESLINKGKEQKTFIGFISAKIIVILIISFLLLLSLNPVLGLIGSLGICYILFKFFNYLSGY